MVRRKQRRKQPWKRRSRGGACKSLQWHGAWALLGRILGYHHTTKIMGSSRSVVGVLVANGMVEARSAGGMYEYRLLPGTLSRARAVLAVVLA